MYILYITCTPWNVFETVLQMNLCLLAFVQSLDFRKLVSSNFVEYSDREETHNVGVVGVYLSVEYIFHTACSLDWQFSSISPSLKPTSQNGTRNQESGRASTIRDHCPIPDFKMYPVMTLTEWPYSIREWTWNFRFGNQCHLQGFLYSRKTASPYKCFSMTYPTRSDGSPDEHFSSEHFVWQVEVSKQIHL